MKIIIGNEVKQNYFNNSVVKNENNYRFILNKNKKKTTKFIKNFNQQIKNYSIGGRFYKLVDDKLIFYRKNLARKLNQIHKVNFPLNYWGCLIDTFLLDLIAAIISDYDTFSQIKKRYRKTIYEYDEKEVQVNETDNLFSELYDLNFQKNFSAKAAEVLKINIKKKTKIFEKIKFKKKNNFFSNIIKKFYISIIYVLKPTLVDGSLLKLRYKFFDIKFIDKKIHLLVKTKFLQEHYEVKKDYNKRELLRIDKVTDNIDKIFNELIKSYFPTSFLENFFKFKASNEMIVKNCNSLILTSPFRTFDNIKIILADLKYLKKKKTKILSHGPFENLRKKSRSYDYCKKYSDQYFSFDKNRIIDHTIFNLSKFNKIDSKNKILIFSTVTRAFHNNNFFTSSHENHPFFSSDLKFYNCLNKKMKSITYVKLFPSQKNSLNFTKAIWDKYILGNNRYLFKFNNFDKYHNFNLLVLNEVSTPLLESIISERPFIVINFKSLINLNEELRKSLSKLKKFKLVFDDYKKASKYVNRNIDELLNNWHRIVKSKEFNELKKITLKRNVD